MLRISLFKRNLHKFGEQIQMVKWSLLFCCLFFLWKIYKSLQIKSKVERWRGSKKNFHAICSAQCGRSILKVISSIAEYTNRFMLIWNTCGFCVHLSSSHSVTKLGIQRQKARLHKRNNKAIQLCYQSAQAWVLMQANRPETTEKRLKGNSLY